MTKAEQVWELWRRYGWLVEPERYTPPEPEAWCHGFEGPAPEREPEIKVERGEER